jgi:alkanesulfonate monooxygenase
MTRPDLRVHWFLPTAGDGRDVAPTDPAARRDPSMDYLVQVARAAEHLGFEGVLTPTGTWCEDAWVTTAALTRETERLKFLVAFRPGFLAPTLAAQMASTYQRISGGRLLLNVVTGGNPGEQQRFGDWLDHDARYARTAEFLTVLRGAWSGEPFDFDGDHYRVAGATTLLPPDPLPAVYFGGASPAAEAVAVGGADVYLAWGEPPAMLAERLDRVRDQAARAGRALRFGLRIHVISRDRADDAWAQADRLLDGMDDETIAHATSQAAQTESVGQQRMASLHGGSKDDLVIAPNLWAGLGLVRGGAGTALVGSHDEVAERLLEYAALGIDELILSGYPHLEEAYWVGEGVLPRLGLGRAPAPMPALGGSSSR